MRVLIVDDNVEAADLLSELLSLQDHTVECAYTAAQALAAAAHSDFDAALIDIALPDLPGTEVARQLRAMAGSRPLMLVAISGFAPTQGEERRFFDHQLQKPIDFETLDRLMAGGPPQP